MPDIVWVITLENKPISKTIDSLEEAKSLAVGAEVDTEKLRIEGFTVKAGQPTLVCVREFDVATGNWLELKGSVK